MYIYFFYIFVKILTVFFQSPKLMNILMTITLNSFFWYTDYPFFCSFCRFCFVILFGAYFVAFLFCIRLYDNFFYVSGISATTHSLERVTLWEMWFLWPSDPIP